MRHDLAKLNTRRRGINPAQDVVPHEGESQSSIVKHRDQAEVVHSHEDRLSLVQIRVVERFLIGMRTCLYYYQGTNHTRTERCAGVKRAGHTMNMMQIAPVVPLADLAVSLA